VASDDSVLWSRDEHTRAKHELLLAFFQMWVSVHSGHYARVGGGLVRVFDGFAGPGVYLGGQGGSPVILLRELCNNPNLHDAWSEVQYDFRFVEKDSARAARLKQELSKLESEMRGDDGPGWTNRVRWRVINGPYEQNVPQPTVAESALFLFLDPFGYSHAPMTLTQDLVQQPKSDTLIFLPLSFVNRFKDREGQDVAMDRFFGTPDWRFVPDGPGRPDRLLELFEAQLKKAGLDYVGSFKLKPDRTNAYFIVGGSGNEKGWESIKSGFWAVDQVNGREYQAPAPTPLGQQTMDLGEPQRPQANTEPLLAALRQAFEDRWFTVEEAEHLTALSRFLRTHLRRATLVPAEAAKELCVDRSSGGRQFKKGAGIRMRFKQRPT
jgi:three-Cys-motif partner protein